MKGGHVAALGQPIGFKLDIGELGKGLHIDACQLCVIADFAKGLPRLRIHLSAHTLIDIGEENSAAGLDVVPGIDGAGIDRHPAPLAAAISAEMCALTIGGREARIHILIGIADACEHASAPAGAEVRISPNQQTFCVMAHAGRVAIAIHTAPCIIGIAPDGDAFNDFRSLRRSIVEIRMKTAKGSLTWILAICDQRALQRGVKLPGHLIIGVARSRPILRQDHTVKGITKAEAFYTRRCRALVPRGRYVRKRDIVARQGERDRIRVIAQRRIEEGIVAFHRPECPGYAIARGNDRIVAHSRIDAIKADMTHGGAVLDGDAARNIDQVRSRAGGIDFHLVDRT